MMQTGACDGLNLSETIDKDQKEDLRDGSTILFADRRVKYLKPRIGPYFQAKIEKYVAPTAHLPDQEETNDEEQMQMSKLCHQKLSEPSESNACTKRRRVSHNKKTKYGRCGHGHALSSEASQCSQTSQEFKCQSTELDDSGECSSNQSNISTHEFNRKPHNAQWSIDGSKYIPLLGGLCVHRPSSQPISSHPQSHDFFLAFCRNIFLQMPNSSLVSNYALERLWKREEQWIRSVAPVEDAMTVSGKKRGRKRKIRENPASDYDKCNRDGDVPLIKLGTVDATMVLDEIFDTTSISSQARVQTLLPDQVDVEDEEESQDSRFHENLSFDNISMQEKTFVCEEPIQKSGVYGHDSVIVGLENDEAMLEYLQLQHYGNIDRGKFTTLCSLAMGKSVESRRLARKYQMGEESTGSQQSESWRRRYERGTDLIIGDLRHGASSSIYPYINDSVLLPLLESDNLHEFYPWCCLESSSLQRTKREHEKDEIANVAESTCNGSDDLQSTWNLVLLASKNVLESIQKRSITDTPTFRQVLNIIEKAYALPNPEDAFGRRDSLSRTAYTSMNSLIDYVDTCRNCLAELLDAAFPQHNDGVDLTQLRKVLHKVTETTPLVMEETEILRSILEEAESWESKLINMSDDNEVNTGSEQLRVPQLTLSYVEALALEGKALSLRPRSLVLLEEKIENAYTLRAKICKWKKSMDDEHENIKYVSTMIREANKVNLSFPELSILSRVHKDAEDWMDKAQVALRTRITLSELDALVRSGADLPIDFADVQAKLENRYEQACQWISHLRDIVPCPSEHMSRTAIEIDSRTRDEWFERMIETLMAREEEDKIHRLLDLSSQGSRLSVDIELLGLLQVAIDAKNWSMKAKRWVQALSGDQWRRGKIEDIEEHLKQANIVREKRKTMTGRKNDWSLNHEQELQHISLAADVWFNKYRIYIEGDNRRAQGRPCLSFSTLKKIIDELEAIPCNLGNAGLKMNKIFNQAQNWMNSSRHVLQLCGVIDGPTASVSKASVEELNSVIDDAAKDIAMDLEEVKELQKILSKARKWLDRVNDIVPRRNKRVGRAKASGNSKYTMNEILLLIEEAKSIPLDMSKDIERLTVQLNDLKAWRLSTQSEIRAVVHALDNLCNDRNCYYGLPNHYADYLTQSPVNDSSGAANSEEKTPDTSDVMDDSEDGSKIHLSNDTNVHKMITALVRSAETNCILTVEETMVDFLESVSNWCERVFALIKTPGEIYSENKSLKELDMFIHEAECLLKKRWSQVQKFDDVDDEKLFPDVSRSCTSIISCDLERLKLLQIRRNEFYSWCEKALALLSPDNEKPFSLDALLKLEAEGTAFPPNTVISVRSRASTITQWASSVNNLIQSGTPILYEEAKTKLLEGEKLNVNCQEVRTLRNAVKMTRGWIGRVKKLDLEQGSSDVNIITELLKEHETLLVSSPEYASKLKQAVCNYCICRRPYDGFMIGCDECDEWYHGLCVGVSEAQAEKFDKYICVRCSIKKSYYQLCSSIACTIKKWCDPKELLKVRQNDGQKLQRRIREKKREILKLHEEMESNTRLLQSLSKEGCSTSTFDSTSHTDVYDNTTRPTTHLSHVSNVDVNYPTSMNKQSESICPSSHGSYNTDFPHQEKNDIDAFANDQVPCDDSRTEINELKGKLQSNAKILEQCHQRLNDILTLSNERKELENKEDEMLYYLRYWFVLIRCKIIAPKSMDVAYTSRPVQPSEPLKTMELLSDPMKQAIREAMTLDLLQFVDVNTMISNFSSIGWCLIALGILRRKPHLWELQMLADSFSSVKVPDVKCIGLIRSMISRATSWQSQISKLFDGDISTYDAAVWHEHLSLAGSIPVITPEHAWLECVIADGFKRHCICGGPVRTTLMLSCDSCGSWFHGTCVQVSEAEAESIPLWLCPSCSTSSSSPPERKYSSRVRRWKTPYLADDISKVAPNPTLMWPPFGLADGSDAVAAFGGLVCSIDTADMRTPQLPHHRTKDATKEENEREINMENPRSTDSIDEKINVGPHASAECDLVIQMFPELPSAE